MNSSAAAGQGTLDAGRNARRGMACLTLFALPFVAVGLFTGSAALREIAGGVEDRQRVIFLTLFSLTFTIAGVGIIAMARLGGRRAQREEELRRVYPDQPWMWRDEWRTGQIPDFGKTPVVTLWVFAVLWNLISAPLFLVFGKELEKGNRLILIALLFPLIGIGLLIAAARAAIRYAKFGRSVLVLDAVPVRRGSFRAVIDTKLDPQTTDGECVVKLTCLRQTRSSDSTHEEILWREEDRFPLRRAAPGRAGGLSIPIVFEIPTDQPASSETTSDDQIIWRLDVAADVRGVDYAATFEVPVFGSEVATGPAPPRVVSAGLPENVLEIQRADGATELRVRPSRPPALVSGLTVFLLFWFGAVALMIALDAPLIFPIVFVLFGLILVAALVDIAFGSATVVVRNGVVQVDRFWPFAHSSKTLTLTEIASVGLKIGTQQTGSTLTPYYDVVLNRHTGRKVVVAAHLRDKRRAEALVHKLERLLGVRS